MTSETHKQQLANHNIVLDDVSDLRPPRRVWAGKAAILLLLLFIAGLATAATIGSLPVNGFRPNYGGCKTVLPVPGFIVTADSRFNTTVGKTISAASPVGEVDRLHPYTLAF